MRTISWGRTSLCAVAVLGCSSADRAEPKARASTPATTALRAIPKAARRLGAARPLAREGSTWFAAAPAAFASALRVEFPAHAQGAVRIERSSAVWMEVLAEGLADANGAVDGEAIVYPRVAPETDLVQLFDGEVAEELRILRTRAADTTFSWRVRLGPALSTLRISSGYLQAFDAEGRARLRAEPLVAWDAEGHERALDVALETITPGEVRLTARLDTQGLAYPIVVDPAWGATSKMANARYDTTPAVLGSGRVVVPGGRSATGAYLASTEIFDPATLTWTLVKPMKLGRAQHATTVLSDGRVMVVTGQAPSATSSCELYDPATDTWTDGPNFPAALWAGAVVAVGGKVAFGGGSGNTSNTYTFDEPAGPWLASATKLSGGRYDLAAIAYSPTRALFIGGSAQWTDIYDSVTNTFAPGPALVSGRIKPGVAKLTSGRLLIVGGNRADSEIFDPATSTVSIVGGIGTLHESSFSIAPLPGDRAIFSGSYSTTTATNKQTHIFDGTSGSWSQGPDTIVARHGTISVGLPDGRALIAGGLAPNTTSSAYADSEVYADSVSIGAACTTGGQCASSFCVQGKCCDRACVGTCESCAETGSIGTCVAIAGTPRAGHGTCGGSGSCAGTCDGTSPSCTYPSSSFACVTGSCVGGLEQPTAYCSGAGTCVGPAPVKSCGVFVCGAVSCKTACTIDADCVAGRFCNTTTSFCDAKLPNGGACTSASNCASGFCVPGGSSGSICCDKVCTGGCETCGASGSVGVCQLRAKDTVCGADACTGGMLTAAATCDGATATCPAPSPAACPNGFGCAADGKTCKTSCATGADCATGFCDLATAKCATMPSDAGTATDAAPTTDAGPGIAEAGAPQLPAKPAVEGAFQRCTKGSDCSTGFCVDGVCCNTACGDRCHSCALLSAPGICTLEPVGVDLRNECGPANQCLGTCDGSGQCIGAGSGTMCGRNRCSGTSSGVGPAYCSAPGAKCPTDDAVAFECSPYACEPAFGACRSTCSSSATCANGFVCDVPTKACVAPPPAAADEGGCAYVARRRPHGGAVAATFLALACAVRARRRRP